MKQKDECCSICSRSYLRMIASGRLGLVAIALMGIVWTARPVAAQDSGGVEPLSTPPG